MKSPVKNQTGASAVEFALILPFLAVLIFGTIDMACLFYNKQILTNASREGVRRAIVRPDKRNNEIEKFISNYCIDKDTGISRLINFGNGDNLISEGNIIIDQPWNKKQRRIIVEFEYTHLLDGFMGITMAPTKLTGMTRMYRESDKDFILPR